MSETARVPLDFKPSGPPAIEIENLVKRFGALAAVDGVSLSIPRGICYALLGPNGAGKTTLSRMIGAVSRGDAGKLTVLGRDPWREQSEVKARLGVVMQDEVFDEDLNVLRNLQIYGLFFGRRGEAYERKIREMLKFVQLEGREQMPIQALSGGMRRRLMIARALLNEPELLILDEPTTGLDPQVRHAIWATLRALKAKGMTVLLTTHYMEEAEQLADLVGILHKGKLVVEGPPSGLIAKHLPRFVLEFDAHKDGAALDAIAAKSAIERHGDRAFVFHDSEETLRGWATASRLQGSPVRAASLEDVFLKLTGRTLDE
ncbi:MAG: ABC transporter ATP-binding protein [Planctomycetes bacterium]|nr:ABC transporter ATP-binding protein [Planctomycetota bacterium]